jgi:hypothetical protein
MTSYSRPPKLFDLVKENVSFNGGMKNQFFTSYDECLWEKSGLPCGGGKLIN